MPSCASRRSTQRNGGAIQHDADDV